MQLNILKGKIHKARITCTDLHYEGSLAIDENLMNEIGLYSYERILVVNITNGQRLETYAIPGKRGTGEILLNGSASRRGEVGDIITIMSFVLLNLDQVEEYHPKIIILDKNNQIIERKGC